MYISFYQLNEEPFRLTPDPRFLHLAEPHRAVLTTLLEGVVLRKGFVVVTGPIGTGKTTLLHAALQILTERSRTGTPFASAFFVNPTLTRDEFFEALLEEFEVSCSSASKPRRLLALQQMLWQTQKEGGTAILLIDEAHLLNTELLEEIRLLSNTDSYREKLLQIVLCGQPELWSLLRRPDMRAIQQRISSRGQLRALSVAETRAYIAERLHAAGLRAESPFPHATLEAIHRHTEGIPRLINLLCDKCLSVGFANQAKQIGLDILEEAAAALDLSITRPEAEVSDPSIVERSPRSTPRATVHTPSVSEVDVTIPASPLPPASEPASFPSRPTSATVSHSSLSDPTKLSEPAKLGESTMDFLIQALKQNRVEG